MNAPEARRAVAEAYELIEQVAGADQEDRAWLEQAASLLDVALTALRPLGLGHLLTEEHLSGTCCGVGQPDAHSEDSRKAGQ